MSSDPPAGLTAAEVRAIVEAVAAGVGKPADRVTARDAARYLGRLRAADAAAIRDRHRAGTPAVRGSTPSPPTLVTHHQSRKNREASGGGT